VGRPASILDRNVTATQTTDDRNLKEKENLEIALGGDDAGIIYIVGGVCDL
jgi:hypothetical protein